MVRRVGGTRRKSRSKLKKPLRERSKLSLSKYFQTFKAGDKVVLKIEPSVQEGMPPPRFQGNSATVKAKKATCYEVIIKDVNKEKVIVVHPIHLKKV